MNQNEVLKIFRETSALLLGHFELRSGLHSDQITDESPTRGHRRGDEGSGLV